MQKLHPKSVWLFFIQFLARGLIILLFLSFWIVPFFAIFLTRGGTVTTMGEATYYPPPEASEVQHYLFFAFVLYVVFILVYIIFCWIWAKLSYRYYGYDITEDAFKKESGVIWKKYISIPYERIQNVDIYRGVFARILGLSDLHIQTAGYSAMFSGRGIPRGMGAEGRLPGLDKQAAEQLRDELIKRAKGAKQGL